MAIDRNLEARIVDDLWDAIDDLLAKRDSRGNPDPGYNELSYLMRDDRRMFSKLVEGSAELFEYYFEDLYRGDDEDQCIERAVDYVLAVSRANLIMKSRHLQDGYSDAELDDFDDLLREYQRTRDDLNDYRRFGPRGTSSNRQYVQRHDDRNPRRSRHDEGTSMFVNNGFGTNLPTNEDNTAVSARARAMAIRARRQAESLEQQRLDQAQQQQERNQVHLSRWGVRRDTPRPERGNEEVLSKHGFGDNFRSKRERISTIRMVFGQKCMVKPLYAKEEAPSNTLPHYLPYEQCLIGYKDRDDIIHLEVKEVSDMHQDDHKYIIKTMLSQYKIGRDDLNTVYERGVEYMVDGIEVPISMVENSRVESILNEMAVKREIEDGTPFSKLTEDQKRAVLKKAADMLLEERKKAGMVHEHTESYNMPLYPLKLETPVHSIAELVRSVIVKYGDLTDGADNASGFCVEYKQLDLHTRQITSDVEADRFYAVLQKGNTTLNKIIEVAQTIFHISDLNLHTWVEETATRAINLGLKYILKLPVEAGSFYEDIEELGKYFVDKVKVGELTNEQIDMFNQFVCSELAVFVKPTVDEIKAAYPQLTELECEALAINGRFKSFDGDLYVIPYNSVMMGLQDTQYLIDLNDRPDRVMLKQLCAGLSNEHRNYLYTKDRRCFRIIVTGKDEVYLTEVDIS